MKEIKGEVRVKDRKREREHGRNKERERGRKREREEESMGEREKERSREKESYYIPKAWVGGGHVLTTNPITPLEDPFRLSMLSGIET